MLASIVTLLVAVFIVAALFYLSSPYLASRSRQQKKQGVSKRRPSPQGRVSGRVERELYALLNGDRAAAQRLVRQTQLRHAERSEQWCWEKVIFDLKRDRRA